MICLMSDVNTWYMVYEQIRLKWLDTAVHIIWLFQVCFSSTYIGVSL